MLLLGFVHGYKKNKNKNKAKEGCKVNKFFLEEEKQLQRRKQTDEERGYDQCHHQRF